jgi:transposase InsO family protein
MCFREKSVMEQREEFVRLALLPDANVKALAARFSIARSKAYKWIGRWKAEGAAGLADRSRRPKSSPKRSGAALEAAVLAVRVDSNGAWGGRKIAKVLERRDGANRLAPSTVTAILRRHGALAANRAEHPGPWQRFERAEPNELWQMDFKGHFQAGFGRCHPLAVIDDHSRYAIGLQACANQTHATVKDFLAILLRRHGLPLRILCDNGVPWGDPTGEHFTKLTVWLMRLGVAVSHGRFHHPQTQGKEERFNRTLKAEAIEGLCFDGLASCQSRFDAFRNRYNHERPHDSLSLDVPASRYRPSPRAFPETLPPIEYKDGDIVITVNAAGCIHLKGRTICVGRGFCGEAVALRPDGDGRYAVYFCAHQLGAIDLAKLRAGGKGPLLGPDGESRFKRSNQRLHEIVKYPIEKQLS